MPKEIEIRKLRHYWMLYALVFPSVLLVAVFAYYPAVSAFYHAFFRWNGDDINNFVGLAEFRRALGMPFAWAAVALLAAATMVMIPRGGWLARLVFLAAGVVTPLASVAALRHAGVDWHPPEAPGQALVRNGLPWVIAMVICLLVTRNDREARPAWLLWLGVILAARIGRALGLEGPSAWSIALLGAALASLALPALRRHRRIIGLRIALALAALGVAFWGLARNGGGDATLWQGFSVTLVLILANVVKMIPSILTAVLIHRLRSEKANYVYRVLFVVPMIIPGMVYLLIWKFFFEPDKVFNMVLGTSGVLDLLTHLDTWLHWGGIFQPGVNPVWLGSPQLVLPAMIIWGFPWVGVVGVLIYLAGLQSIDTSVYEAADLDGISAVGKFFHIELPLILTQVRINLVLMIIGTLQDYGFVLVLFGDSGGPNGKLMVPGLYMFRQAFIERYVGYACCIGLILFVFMLILTELNNRFLRVEK